MKRKFKIGDILVGDLNQALVIPKSGLTMRGVWQSPKRWQMRRSARERV